MERRWVLFEKKTEDLREQLLINRNLLAKGEVTKFLHPHFNQFIASEELFPELKKVLTRITKAIREKELIYIYGDYDVDGLTASAILWETIDHLGGKVLPYIPSRHSEGYGLHKDALRALAKEGAKVVISVDCGITAVEPAKESKKLKLDLIITDHHQPGVLLPDAFAILHTTSLAGSGVAFKLATSLLAEFGKEVEGQFAKNLELATLGTIADMVPLTGENRIIVKNGLLKLGESERVGLMAIYNEAQVGKRIGTYEVGHVISPRLNAMGRMESALDSLRLLLTRKKDRAEVLAKKLSVTNKLRQEATQTALEHAKNEVEKNYLGGKLFVISSPTYQEGVVGLVAGRITESYHRPTAVISEMRTISKGSARSISGFNITEAIRENSTLLLAHGGHPMAAGFSIDQKFIPDFRDGMVKIAENLITEEQLTPVQKIDAEIKVEELNQELMDVIIEFEPFGIGNSEPVFLTKNLEVVEVKPVGKDNKHIRLVFRDGDNIREAIAFGLAERKPRTADKVDVVYNLRENTWNSRKRLELRVIDFKPSDP